MKPQVFTGRRTFRLRSRYRKAEVQERVVALPTYVDRTVDLELEVDVEGLLDRLGATAAGNKSGKTMLQGGLVVVRVKGAKK